MAGLKVSSDDHPDLRRFASAQRARSGSPSRSSPPCDIADLAVAIRRRSFEFALAAKVALRFPLEALRRIACLTSILLRGR